MRFGPDILNKSQLTIGQGAANYFYSKDKERQYLGSVYTRQVLVMFSSGVNLAQQQELISSLEFVKATGRPVSSGAAVMHALELVAGLNCVQVEQVILQLRKLPEIAYAAPCFLTGTGGQLLGISNELKVQLAKESTLSELELLLGQVNASVLKQLDENTYLVQVDNHAEESALELANHLAGQQDNMLAQPVFLTLPL